MKVVSEGLIKDKKVLLRLDLDVPLWSDQVMADFRLKAALPTIKLCLDHASQTIMIGHLGRPKSVNPQFSLLPVHAWFEEVVSLRIKFAKTLEEIDSSQALMLENLRFFKGEENLSVDFARGLAQKGDFFVMEAFAAYHPAASTTILPTILPHAAGLQFAQEVEKLTAIRENPKRPLIAIVGGAKVEDKYQAVLSLSKICDTVLVGGLLAKEIETKNLEIPPNVVLGQLNEKELDLSIASIAAFAHIIEKAKQVIWAGPLGKYEDPEGRQGNELLAQTIIGCGTESIIGGGDTEAALFHFLPAFGFVSTGGGAMLKFLSDGTLPTIEALS